MPISAFFVISCLVAANFIAGIPLYYFAHWLANKRQAEYEARGNAQREKDREADWDKQRILMLEKSRDQAYAKAYQEATSTFKLMAECLGLEKEEA
jgi:PDZ domain-containing secreted protein